MIAVKEKYPSVEKAIALVREYFRDRPYVASVFETCLSDTLQRTSAPAGTAS